MYSHYSYSYPPWPLHSQPKQYTVTPTACKCICTLLKMHTHSQKVMYSTHLSCVMLKENNNASGGYGWSLWYMMTSLLGLGAAVRLVSGKVS